jgi:hypothetical protein
MGSVPPGGIWTKGRKLSSASVQEEITCSLGAQQDYQLA